MATSIKGSTLKNSRKQSSQFLPDNDLGEQILLDNMLVTETGEVVEDGEKLLDPAKKLPFLNQVQADQRISNQVITPFNLCQIVQTINNPMRPGEIITVMLVNENVRPLQDTQLTETHLKENKSQESANMTCPNCFEHPQLKESRVDTWPVNKNGIVCDVCNVSIDQDVDSAFLYCPNGIIQLEQPLNTNIQKFKCQSKYAVCCHCATKHYVEKKLEQKTKNHHHYQEYEINTGSKMPNQDQEKAPFIRTVSTFTKKDKTPQACEQYAVIQLWKDKSGKNKKSCYKEYRIENPVWFRKSGSERKINLLNAVFLTEDKTQFFFFQKNSFKNQNTLNIVDIDSICEDPLTDSVDYQSIPVTNKIQLSGTLEQAFKNYEQLSEERDDIQAPRLQNVSLPQSSDRIPLLILVINGQTLDAEGNMKSAGSNAIASIFFFDYIKQNVVFVAYDAHYFIKFDSMTDQEIQKHKEHIVQDSDKITVWVIVAFQNKPSKIVQIQFKKVLSFLSQHKKNTLVSQEVQKFQSDDKPKLKTQVTSSLKNSVIKTFECLNHEETSDKLVIFDFSKYEIFAQIHYDRCTILVANDDFYTFELDEKTQKASRIFKLQQMKDATLVENEAVLYVVGNLRPEEKQHNQQNHKEKCTKFLLDFYKIDPDHPSSKQNKQITPKRILANLTSSFNQQNIDIDYKLMPFHLCANKTFQSQLIYADPMTGIPIVLFFSAQLQDQNQNEIDAIQQTQIITRELIYKIQYPLMMYRALEYRINKFYLCNLAQNKTQILLDFGSLDLKFLCFVDTGEKDDNQFFEDEQTRIYFLANKRTQDQQGVHLMYLRVDPWQSSQQDGDLNSCIEVKELTQNIENFDNSKFSSIKKAVMLKNFTSNETKIYLIVQFSTEIYIFQVTKSSCVCISSYFAYDRDSFMAPHLLVTGHWNSCYYVQRQKLGDEIVSMGFQSRDEDFVETVVFKHQAIILQLQIKFDQEPNREKKLHTILILDSEFQLLLLKCQISGLKSVKDSDQQLFIAQQISLQNLRVKRVVRGLLSCSWQHCILSDKYITCSRYLEKNTNSDDNSQRFTSVSCTYNLSNGGFYPFEFFKVKFIPLKSQPEKDKTILRVWDVQQIQDISKNVTLVQEGKKCYFQIDQNPDTNRIDLMNHQSQNKSSCKGIYVLKYVILVQLETKYLVFSQKEFILIKTGVEIEVVKVLVTDSENSLQYVEVKQLKPFTKPQKILIVVFKNNGEYDIVGQDLTNIILSYAKKFIKTSIGSPPRWIQNQTCHFLIKHSEVQTGHNTPQLNQDERNVQIAQSVVDPNSDSMCQYKNQLKIKYIYLKNCLNITGKTRCICTQDFLVFTTSNEVQFVKLPRFENPKDIEPDQVIYTQNRLQTINLSNLFIGDEEMTENFRIYTINQLDLTILSKARRKHHSFGETNYDDKNFPNQVKNAIQISINNKAVIWDLDINCELHFIVDTSTLKNPNNYVVTGFKIEDPSDDGKASEQEKSIILANYNNSIFSTTSSSTQIGQVFRLFTRLNLLEMVGFHQVLRQGLSYEDQIDFSVLTANIYGQTFFSLNYFWIGFMEKIYLQVYQKLKNTNDGFFDNFGDPEDPIFVRKMFFLLTLPYQPLPYCTMPQGIDFKLKKKDKFQPYKQNQESKDQLPISCIQRNLEFLLTKQSQLGRLPSLMLQRKKVTNLEDSSQQTHKNSLLFLIQEQNTQNFQKHKAQSKNLVQCLIQENNPIFTLLIKFLLLSQEINLRDLINDFQDFKDVFRLNNEEISKFLENSFIRTDMSKRLQSVQWDSNKKILVFGNSSAQLSAKQINQRIENDLNTIKIFNERAVNLKQVDMVPLRKFQPIDVRILDVRWLKKDIVNFYKFLGDSDDSSLFGNALIKVLLHQQHYTWEIIRRIMIPFVIYMVSCLVYFSFFLTKYEDSPGLIVTNNTGMTITQLLMILSTLYLARIELRQYGRSNSTIDYLNDKWNLLQIVNLTFNMFILIEHSIGRNKVSYQILCQCASVAALLLWMGFFYWVRLFSQTAFYIQLISSTLKDAFAFLLIFVLLLFMFANAILILDQYNLTQRGYTFQRLVLDQTGNDVFDYTLDQYLSMLGMPYTSNYSTSDNTIQMWIYYIISSFMSSIIFLNMLVAIMSDTFNRVTDQKIINGLKQQTEIFADFIAECTLDKTITQNAYLYMVTPVFHDSQDIQNSPFWEGGYNVLRRQIQQIERSLKALIKGEEKTTQQAIQKVEKLVKSVEQVQLNVQRQVETQVQKTNSPNTLQSQLTLRLKQKTKQKIGIESAREYQKDKDSETEILRDEQITPTIKSKDVGELINKLDQKIGNFEQRFQNMEMILMSLQDAIITKDARPQLVKTKRLAFDTGADLVSSTDRQVVDRVELD